MNLLLRSPVFLSGACWLTASPTSVGFHRLRDPQMVVAALVEMLVVEKAKEKDLFPVYRRGDNIPVETMPKPNNQLIAEFNDRRSEEAFAALVRQHVNLVFATALRQVGDAGAAEEITQNVFVALAQAAGKLGSHPTIAGWLHQTALNKSREWLRSELRRRRREQVAFNLDLVRAERLCASR